MRPTSPSGPARSQRWLSCAGSGRTRPIRASNAPWTSSARTSAGSTTGLRFFDGEVEPCINGATVAIGDYFGQDVQGIVDRLLGEQMDDGGWNCEQENGSMRGSFDTTINVLEGLLEHERATGAHGRR